MCTESRAPFEMAALVSLLVAAVSSAGAGLPTRRAAKDPWPTAAPSAEAVRQLHELLPLPRHFYFVQVDEPNTSDGILTHQIMSKKHNT